ncbi:outer-membrane lipoprotein LolB [Cellvibrio zantedeschiae]|uniref:Outer-membrane lipoprotein LolB n=1 Tax=Cellvibrio zantedeschiae TaxID=1237077 RepID=A0ABQ3B8C1_9GAMM|nr:lipoprotein insertase outer membrane protein LolB [Cellvibrio zantedeschiae]GGY79862.1 outer-membrane lipoprotein LolB [Cellvibrio zantedeschiae]
MKVFPALLLLRLLFISLLLSGCAHKLPKAPLISEDWPKHQAQVEALGKWQATGKLGVKVPNDGGSMTLRWQQQPNDFAIDFTGPFGQNILGIAGKAGEVTLSEPGKAPITAKTAEELIRRNTGWTIPVAQLTFWVRGLPAPTAKITHFAPNAQGLIGELEQLGWKVTYGEYLSVNAGTETLAMPGRITAEFKDMRLTLVIREWQMEPAL